MGEAFLKSTLPVRDSFVLGDTSLALPAKLTTGSSTKAGSKDRSLRVQQQVQLTLSRKARKSESYGGVHLDKIKAKSFDATDVSLSHMKVNGLDFSRPSHVQRPSRRVEVSPPPTPEFLKFNYTPRWGSYGAYTFPEHSQSYRVGTLDHSRGSDSFGRCAFSEVPRGSQLHTSSSSTHRSVRRRSQRQTAGPQQSGEYGFRWGDNQTAVKQDKWFLHRKNDMVLGAVQPVSFRRMNSYPHSDISMELDLPVQQAKMQNVMTLQETSENKAPEMTVERAVSLLSQDDEEMLIGAVSYIQNECHRSADAQKMVSNLHGIEKLLQLVVSDNEEVQRLAAGALRNVVFQNNNNKEEVMGNDGLACVLDALKSSRDVDTRRQLTGLLWTLSSHEPLKERLSREALSVLTESVLVPGSGISEGENPKHELLMDADVFHFATHCLRNISSGGPACRKAMRNCGNLIDCLVFYIRRTIADRKTDDESAEHCIFILNNLSYEMEAELPRKYLKESQQNLAPKPKTVGCFASRSAKITEHLEQQSPLLEEKSNPCGIEWLWNTITVRMYLSLIACSVCHSKQEAAIGALHNITARIGVMSQAIAFTIVRENGLQHMKKVLQEGESNVKMAAISLIRNLSHYPKLQPDIVKKVLPDAMQMLFNDDSATDLSSDVMVPLFDILTNLSQTDSQTVKDIFKQGALQRIINISREDNGYGQTRAAQAACKLLHTMWSHSELHGFYKKCGYRKSDFINPRTTKAVNSGRNFLVSQFNKETNYFLF
ncbi:plakophilin-2 [Anabas testudineus]|uniref:plakophilin-2 n=1 Tax=Anabas testudineus TaxID=64144 RepID=UPI000E458232|nr:plakophilin-2 [Anabas testudineus]